MLTSGQVAAMMAQQQQMFMGLNQQAQVISASMPGPYSVGAFGFPQAAQPQFPQVPFTPGQQPGFNYGVGTPGYGFGNQMGAAGVTAMAGGARTALQIGGIAAGIGLMSGPTSWMLDPFKLGGVGWRAAGSMGMGLGGKMALGGLGVGLAAAPGMIVGHGLSEMVTGAQEQAGIDRAMGQFNFINPLSRSGRGFTRFDTGAIGGMVRDMAAIPEMMSSVGELTRIMDRMGQMGMMSGVRDVREFGRRFKEQIQTLQDVAKMMGSTMEDALQFVGQMKTSGFYSRNDILRNAINNQVTSGITGMNQNQINQLQQAGSQLSFAMGGTRAGGARSISRIANELGVAHQRGLLTNEQLLEMTGMEGAEGIQALSGGLAEAGARMSRSSLGTALTLALGETKDGKFTGKMDEALVDDVRRGRLTKADILRMAHQKIATRGAKLSFAAHRKKLTAEMTNAVGAQGMMMELQTILGERGWHNPDALNLVMQKYGLDERTAEMVIELGKQMPSITQDMGIQADQEMRRAVKTAISSQRTVGGAAKKLGTEIKELFRPFADAGAAAYHGIGNTIDGFVDELLGNFKTITTQEARELHQQAARGSSEARRELAEALRSTSQQLGFGNGAGGDLRSSGLQSIYNMATPGAYSQGEVAHMAFGALNTRSDFSENASVLQASGNTLLRDMAGGTLVSYIGEGRRRRVASRFLSMSGQAEQTAASKDLLSRLNGMTELQDLGVALEKMYTEGGESFAKKTLGSRLNAVVNDGDTGAIIKRIQAKLGPGSDVSNAELIMAAQNRLKMGGRLGAFTGDELAGAVGVEGVLSDTELKKRVDARGKLEDSIASKFGSWYNHGVRSSVKSILQEGGLAARAFRSMYDGSGQGSTWAALMQQQGSFTDEQRKFLRSQGITEEQARGLQTQLRPIMASGAVDQEELRKLFGQHRQATLAEGELNIRAENRDIGASLVSRLKEISDTTGKYTGKDKAALEALQKYNEQMASTGQGGDAVAVAEALLDTSKGARRSLSRVAGGNIQAALSVGERLRSRRGRTLSQLGLTDEAISAHPETWGLDKGGQEKLLELLRKEKVDIGRGSTKLTADQEKKIESLLMNLASTKLPGGVGATTDQKNTQIGSQMVDVFKDLTKVLNAQAEVLRTFKTNGEPPK